MRACPPSQNLGAAVPGAARWRPVLLRQRPGLSQILSQYGIDFHTTLSQLIARNTDVPASEIHPDAFIVADDELLAANCSVAYQITSSWPGQFGVNMRLTNLTSTPINGWTLRFQFSNGQTFATTWNGNYSLNGVNATVSNVSYNATIPAGGSMDGVGFNGNWDDAADAIPINFTVNNQRCALG